MAQNINFAAQFAVDQQSLKQTFNAVKAVFSKAIALNLKTSTKRPSGQKQPGGGATDISGAFKGLTSNLIKVFEESAKAFKKLSVAQLKKAANLERSTSKDVEAAKIARASLGGFTSAVKRARFQFNKIDAQVKTAISDIADFQNAVTLAKKGLKALPSSGKLSKAPETPDLTSVADQAKIAKLIVISSRARLKEVEIATKLVADLNIKEEEAKQIKKSQNEATGKHLNTLRKLSQATIDLETVELSIKNSAIDTAKVSEKSKNELFKAARTLSDITIIYDFQKNRLNAQSAALEKIENTQGRIKLESRLELEAVKTVRRAAEKRAKTLGGGGRTESLAIATPDTSKIGAAGADALKDFRNRINNTSDSISSLDIAFEEGAPAQRKFNKVLNDAVNTQSIIANELGNQVAVLISNLATQQRLGTLTQEQANATVGVVQQLRKTATDLQSLSRPISAMSERTIQIAVASGKLASDVAKSLGFEKGSKAFGAAVNVVKEAFKGAGSSAEQAVKNLSEFSLIKSFVGELKVGSTQFKETVNVITKSIKETDVATRATEKSLSAVGEASTKFATSLKGSGAKAITGAIGTFKDVIAKIVSSFSATGLEVAELGKSAGTTSEVTKRFQQSLRAAIEKTRQFAFLKDIGVDVEGIITKALEKAGSKFSKDFASTSKRLDAELLTAAKAFASNLINQTQKQDLIKPGFLDGVEKKLSAAFTNLGPELTEKVLAPLRAKIDKIQVTEAFDQLRAGARDLAGRLASGGVRFSDALRFVQAGLGKTAEAEKITREEFKQAARRRIDAEIELARKTAGTSFLKDTDNVDSAIERFVQTLIKVDGQLENDARTLLQPLKRELEKIRFNKLESAAISSAKEIANLAVLFRSRGGTFAEALEQAGGDVKVSDKVLKEFNSVFRRGGFDFVRRMQDTALAFNKFKINVDEVADKLVTSFGFDANEAKIITKKLNDEVKKVRLEKFAIDFGKRVVNAGRTLDSALKQFKENFANKGPISPKAIQNIERAFSKAEKEFLKFSFDKLVKGKINLDAVQKRLVAQFDVSPQVAKLTVAKLEKDAAIKRVAIAEKDSIRISKENDKRIASQRRVSNVLEKLAKSEEEAVRKINQFFSGENFLSSLKKGGAVGGPGPLKDFSLKSLKDFGQKLDLSSQEKFITLLKKEDVSLQTVNTQLKAHQGNLAKSNKTVDQITSSMTSSQKAAFQFGFAAANAADRLAAWATPAAFIFKATSALKQAVSTIIRLDETISRIAFFNADTLDKIAGGINVFTSELGSLGTVAGDTKGAFDSLNNSTQQFIVLTAAAARTQQILIDRARETGIELEKLADIALISGRVNREAFDIRGNINPFAEAIEGLLRIEGPLANAADLTAKLNSVLNQFQLSGEATILVAAQIGEVAQRSAFGAAELAEGLTRIGGAFSSVQGATVAESLEFLSAASNSAQTSVARVATALRQLSVNVAEGADEIKEFSGLEIVTEGQLRGPEALIEVLGVINSFEGQEAALSFITQFTDKRNASIILGLARNLKTLEANFESLGTREQRVAKETAALRKFFSQQEIASRTLSSELNKLRATLVATVQSSGVIEFFTDSTRAFVGFASAVSSGIKSINGLGPIFAGVFLLLLPTLQAVAAGFRAGLLPVQKIAATQQKIATALFEEENLLKAINLAKTEGLIKDKDSLLLLERARTISFTSVSLGRQLEKIEVELLISRKEFGVTSQKVISLEAKRLQLNRDLVASLQSQSVLQKDIEQSALRGGTGFINKTIGPKGLAKIGRLVGSAFIAGGLFAAEPIGKLIGGQVGKEVEKGLTGAVIGALIGGILGPIGSAVGAIVGGFASIALERKRISDLAEAELKINLQIGKSLALSLKSEEKREARRVQTKQNILDRANLEKELTKELEIINKRIQLLAEQGIKNKGLEAAAQKVQIDLGEILAQQKELEKRKLAETLKFEESIAKIKREQNSLSTIANLIQDARIALLDKTKSIAPVIEAEIKAEVDEKQLAIEARAIQKRIGEVDVRLFSLSRSTTADAQQIKQIAGERLKLKQEEQDLELKTIQIRFKRATDALDAAESFSDREEDRFKSIADAFTNRIEQLVTSQKEIVDLLGQEAEVFKEIASVTDEGLQNAIRAGGGGIVKDITDLNVKQQRQIIKQRNRILLDGARKATEILKTQFAIIGEVEGLDKLDERASSINQKFAELGGATGEFIDGLKRSTKFKFSELEAERQLFDTRKKQTLQSIQVEKNSIQILNQLNRDKISLINQEIDVLQRRIDKETEIGEKLINAPGEFLKETRKIFSAENILDDARVDSKNIEIALLKVISEVNRVSGFAGIQEFFSGLKAAESRDEALVEGVTPGQLSSLFARLVANPNAKLVAKSVSEQRKLVNEIGSLLDIIKQSSIATKALISQEIDIAKLLKTNVIGKLQLTELFKISQQSKAAADAAIKNVGIAETELKNISTQLVALGPLLNDKLDFSAGDKKIVDAVEDVARILSRIESFIPEGPDVAEPKVVTEARQQLKILRAGDIPEGDIKAFREVLITETKKDRRSRIGLRNEFRRLALELASLTSQQAAIVKFNKDRFEKGLDVVGSPLDILDIDFETFSGGGGDTQLGRVVGLLLSEDVERDKIKGNEKLVKLTEKAAERLAKATTRYDEILKELDDVVRNTKAFKEAVRKEFIAARILQEERALKRFAGKEFAAGGRVSGRGGIDNVPALLTAGEFVIKRGQVGKFLPLLQAINSGRLTPERFQKGGIVRFQDGGVVDNIDGPIDALEKFKRTLQEIDDVLRKREDETLDEIIRRENRENAEALNEAAKLLLEAAEESRRVSELAERVASAERVAAGRPFARGETPDVPVPDRRGVTFDDPRRPGGGVGFLESLDQDTLDAVEEVTAAIRDEGFGNLQELSNRLGLDVAKALKERIQDFREGPTAATSVQLENLFSDLGLSFNRFITTFDEIDTELFGTEGRGLPGGPAVNDRGVVAAINNELISTQILQKLEDLEELGKEEDFENKLLEVLAPGRLAKEIAATVKVRDKQLDTRPIKERIAEARAAGPQALEEVAARQIAAMERILAVANASTPGDRPSFAPGASKLSSKLVSVLEQQLAQLKLDNPIAAASLEVASKSIEEQKNAKTAMVAGLDHLFPPLEKIAKETQKTEGGTKGAGDNKATDDASSNSVNATNKTTESVVALTASNTAALASHAEILKEIVAELKKQSTTAKIEIDEASQEEFVNLFKAKFDEACQLWVQQFIEAINNNTISVEASDVAVVLGGTVRTELVGADFIAQLRDAFLGTGLEDRVDDIARTIAELVQFHQDNDTSVARNLGASQFVTTIRPGPTIK